jgi:hypothetical protein
MIERIDIEPPAQSPECQETQERGRQQVEEAAGLGKQQGQSMLKAQKQRVASELRAYSSAARRAASRLEEESDLHLSRYVSGAAERLDALSRQVEQRDFGEMWDDLESMARRRPEIYFGGMFVAGLAVARFLKASRRKRMRSRFERAADEGDVRRDLAPASIAVPVPGFPSGGAPEFPEVGSPSPETYPSTDKPCHG